MIIIGVIDSHTRIKTLGIKGRVVERVGEMKNFCRGCSAKTFKQPLGDSSRLFSCPRCRNDKIKTI